MPGFGIAHGELTAGVEGAAMTQTRWWREYLEVTTRPTQPLVAWRTTHNFCCAAAGEFNCHQRPGLGPVVALPWSSGGWRAQQQGSSYRGGLDPHLRTTTRKAHQSGRQGDTPVSCREVDSQQQQQQQRQRSNFSMVLQHSSVVVYLHHAWAHPRRLSAQP